jgi:uncharacterized membrane protein
MAVLALSSVILASLVHFIVILTTPFVATGDAYARLVPLGQVGQTVTLPRADPNERMLANADPAVAMSVCRYDLRTGPLRVQAPAGRAFSSIAFHTLRGLVFYALTDKAAARGVIDVVIAMPADVRALDAHDDEEAPSRDLRVAAPAPEGYVVMRVFSETPSLYPEAEANASRLTCKEEPVPR